MGMEAVGKYLKQLRDTEGLTQAEASARVGLNSKTVERWEAGTHEPKLSTIEPYVNAIGGDITEVIKRLVGVGIDQNVVAAAELLARLSPAQRRLLTELARELLHEREV